MRKYCLLILLTLGSISIESQNNLIEPELWIGTTQGAVGSFANFVPSISQGFQVGYTGGIFFRYVSEKYFGVQADILYSQRGWVENTGNPAHSYSCNMDYMEIPVLTYAYVGNKLVRGYLLLGPKIGFLVNWQERANFAYIDPTTGAKLDLGRSTDHYGKRPENIFDWGITAGLGIEFQSTIGNFGLEARYGFGLGDMYSNKKGEDFGTSSMQSVYVQLTYLFNCSKYSRKGYKPKF